MRAASDMADPEMDRPPARAMGAFSVADLIDLLRRRWLLVACTAGATVLLAGLYVARQTPVYRATAELLIDPQALQVVGRDIVRTDTAASIDFANVDSQALVLVSTSVLRQVIDELHLERDPAFATQPGFMARHFGSLLMPSADEQFAATLETLKKNIVVHRVDNSLVFQITVSHPEAKRSAEIANTLASVYFRQGNEGRSGAVRRANTGLIAQIAGLRDQLTRAENATEAFRSQNGLVSAGDSGLIVNQQVKDLYTQINIASAEVARQTARRDQAAKLGANALLTDTIPEALGSPTITALRAQYAQTAREAASLAETLMPRHPQLMQAQAQLAETKRQLAAELGRIRGSIQEAYNQAAANLANLQAQAKELTKSQSASSAAEIKLRELQGEADAIRTVYNASLSRARELEQQQKIETSNSRLISEAVPPLRASKPPAALVLAAAALFGACAGLGLAYLLEWMPALGGVLQWKRKPKVEKAEPTIMPDVSAAPRSIPANAIISARMTPDIAAMPALPVARDLPPYDIKALAPLADILNRHFSDNTPAVVLIASLAGERVCRQAAKALGAALNGAGIDVTTATPNTNGDNLRIESIERAVKADPSISPTADGGIRILNAASSTSIHAAFAALRGGRGQAATEFMLMQATDRKKLASMAAAADAILVVTKPNRDATRDMTEIETLLGPLSDRLLARIEGEGRVWTLPGALRGRRAAA